MTIHCRDCWQDKEQHKEKTTDLCDGCWQARVRLLEAFKAGAISHAEFVYCQTGESRRTRIAKTLKEQTA